MAYSEPRILRFSFRAVLTLNISDFPAFVERNEPMYSEETVQVCGFPFRILADVRNAVEDVCVART